LGDDEELGADGLSRLGQAGAPAAQAAQPRRGSARDRERAEEQGMDDAQRLKNIEGKLAALEAALKALRE